MLESPAQKVPSDSKGAQPLRVAWKSATGMSGELFVRILGMMSMLE